MFHLLTWFCKTISTFDVIPFIRLTHLKENLVTPSNWVVKYICNYLKHIYLYMCLQNVYPPTEFPVFCFLKLKNAMLAWDTWTLLFLGQWLWLHNGDAQESSWIHPEVWCFEHAGHSSRNPTSTVAPPTCALYKLGKICDENVIPMMYWL